MYMFCAIVESKSLSHCWLQIIYNWANNSLTSKGYESNVHTWLHAALALISKQEHLLTTTAVSIVQNKWHRSVYGNGLFAFRTSAALIGYAALVCVEQGMSHARILL